MPITRVGPVFVLLVVWVPEYAFQLIIGVEWICHECDGHFAQCSVNVDEIQQTQKKSLLIKAC